MITAAAALPRVRAHREPARLRQAGRNERADHQSARHRRLRRELRGTRFTVITGVNTLYHALLDAPGFDAVCAANRGALKLAVAGGMAVQRDVAERWQRATAVPLVEGYGLTEASPIVCANPIDASEFSGKLGTAGALDRGGDPATRRGTRLPRGRGRARSACAGRR